MKKLILPIILPFFISLIMFFIFISPAQAINLRGEWIAEKGARAELSQSGNTFSLVVTYSRFEKLIGITTVKGTITGDTFIGQIYTYNDECPNLNGLVPAKGTISEGKIEIKFTRHAYDLDTCVRIPNSDSEGSNTYTRISTPSPTLAEKPEEEKQEDNTRPDQIQSEGKENLVIKALGGFPVFIGDWFMAVSTGWGMKEFFYQNELFADEVLFGRDRREIAEEEAAEQKKDIIEAQKKRDEFFDKQGLADLDEVLNRMPAIKETPDYQTGEWQQDSPFRLDVLEGQVQIRYPGESAWRDIKVGDKIPPGATIFTGMDTTTVLSIKDKGVVQILPFTEITISEEGLAEPGKTTTEIDLRAGEVELNLPSGIFTGSLQVFTTNAVAGVKGTHFWVSHDPDKKQTNLAVYEGKVEVKTRDGKITTVAPNGDEPGIVVVSTKLSIIKVFTALGIIAVIVSLVFWFIRKKTAKKKR